MDRDRPRTKTEPHRNRWCWLLALACAPCLADEGSAAASAALPRAFSVIELPPPSLVLPMPGRQRSHHALSFATETPRTLLRSLGVEASDCSMRLRLPSRLTAAPRVAGPAVRLEVQAQAGLACRF